MVHARHSLPGWPTLDHRVRTVLHCEAMWLVSRGHGAITALGSASHCVTMWPASSAMTDGARGAVVSVQETTRQSIYCVYSA